MKNDLEIDEAATFPSGKIEDKIILTLDTNKDGCKDCFAYKLDDSPFTDFQGNFFTLSQTLEVGKHRLLVLYKDPSSDQIDTHIYAYNFTYERTSGKPMIRKLYEEQHMSFCYAH